MKNFILSLLCLSAILIFASCSPPNEKAHPVFQKAEKAFKDGDYQQAADGYQEYLDFNRKSKITHYKLAGLYRDYLDNPFLAAYHYRRYLVYEPDSPDKEAIETWITSSEKHFAQKIQQKYPKDFPTLAEFKKLQEDKARLITYARQVKKQNAALLKKFREGSSGSSSGKGSVVVAEGMQEVYTVQSGDTLTKISKKVYGTSKHYKLIYKANKNTMSSEAALNIGQKLQIPKLKKVSGPTNNEDTDSGDDAGLITDFP